MIARAMLPGLLIGTMLQVAMVVAGHFEAWVQDWFAIGGMGISALAGVIAAWRAPRLFAGALAGALAGTLCALIGIGVSVVLGDVPAVLLLIGSSASLVTGGCGGIIGWAWSGRR